MEFLLLGLVLGVSALGLLIFFGLSAMASADSKERENAPAKFDEKFDGTPTVVWTAGVLGVKAEQVIEAASERGYRLANSVSGRYDKVLTFERTDA